MGSLADRYQGPIEIGQVLTCPDNDGVLGLRRVRVLARHPDDEKTLILEELPSRMLGRRLAGEVFRCPEINLRVVFVPEEADALTERGADADPDYGEGDTDTPEDALFRRKVEKEDA